MLLLATEMTAPSPAAPTIITWGTLALSIAVGLASTLTLSRRERGILWKTMGTLTWDFSRSWASNLSIAGGILGPALVLTAVPDPTRVITKQTYVVLSTLFTTFVALAPFLFTASRRMKSSGKDGAVEVSEGAVAIFILSAVFTIWGAFGQIVIASCLVREFQLAKVLTFSVSILMYCLLGATICLFVYYAYASIVATALSQVKPPARHTVRLNRKDLAEFLVNPGVSELEGVPSRSWHLL